MVSLRDRRQAAGLSLRQVATQAGLHHPEVSLIERGLRPAQVDTVYRLARVLGDDVLVAALESALPGLFVDEVPEGTRCRHALANTRFLDVPGVGSAQVCRCGVILKATAWPLRHP